MPVRPIPPHTYYSSNQLYSALTIRAFLETRRQFTQVLSNSNSGLNMSRYFRLMALAATEMLFSLPLSIYLLVTNLTGVLNPWVSWEDTHQNFGHINFIPRVYMLAVPHVKLVIDMSRWVTPAGGLLFFAYFGLAGEASAEYRRILWKVLAPLGIKPPATKPQSSAWYVLFDLLVQFIGSDSYFPLRSNRLVSGNSSTGRDVVTFPTSRPTFDAIGSVGTTTADDKSAALEIEIKHDTESKHDLESQVSR